MAQKFDVISELYDRACLEIITDPVNGNHFSRPPEEILSCVLTNSSYFSYKDLMRRLFLKSNVGMKHLKDGLIRVQKVLLF